MKFGIMIDKTGTYLLKMPEDSRPVTMPYIRENMIGWLFNVSDIYNVITLLPVSRYFISLFQNEVPSLLEITEEEAKNFYLSILNFPKEQQEKLNK